MLDTGRGRETELEVLDLCVLGGGVVVCADEEPGWLEVPWLELELGALPFPLPPVAPVEPVDPVEPALAGAVAPPEGGAASAAPGADTASAPNRSAIVGSMCLVGVMETRQVAPAHWNTAWTANVADTAATGRVAAASTLCALVGARARSLKQVHATLHLSSPNVRGDPGQTVDSIARADG